MLIKVFVFIFGKLIGKIPEDKKAVLVEKFKELLTEMVKAGVKGAIEGAKDR